MEQEKTAIDVKGYKKQARTAAASYLKRKRAAKGEERKAVKKEQKQKILAWKLGLVALSKPERKAQKKAFKAYKKRLALMRTIAVWVALILVLALALNAASPLIHNIGAIMGQKYTDQTEEAKAARAAGEAFATDISDEGIVLLKNENDLLPLVNKKVNIFGDDAYNFK